MDNSKIYTVNSPSGANESIEEESSGLGERLAELMEHRWLISSMCAGGLFLGGAFGVIKPPEYMASGLIQVEENASSSMSALKDFGSLLGLGGDTTVAAEQEILSSKMILDKVIERQSLNIIAEPKNFPIVGRVIAKSYTGSGLADAPLNLNRYAWGGELIKVGSLEVPLDMLDENLTLILRDNEQFDIYRDLDEPPVLSGKAGSLVTSGGYSVFVSSIKGRPGVRFNLSKISPDEIYKELGKRYAIKERGKKSGILEVTYTGKDRNRIEKILDDIFNSYVRQNIERRSAEAENTLKFLEKQIPEVKLQMDAAESKYNQYRQSRGSLDLSIETQSVLQSLVDIDNQIVSLRQERDELRQYFTVEHPRIQATDAKLEKLKARRAQFDAQVGALPDTQQEVLRLARDVEISTALYTNLVNTAQQLRVSKAGTVGDVRVIDSAAATVKPIGIKPIGFAAIGTLFGLFASFGIIAFNRALRVVVNNPEEIEAKLGLPVYASIPHSRSEGEISKRVIVNKVGELLAVSNPDDDAIESIRSLRTTIHFALMDSVRKSILVAGPSPGLGKSFVSKNLAAVLAQAGKRIVIVDADLRRGHINKEFGLKREGGISEYVTDTAKLEEIVKATAVPNLWVVTTGQISPNPSELIMSLRFEELLEELDQQFDMVIIDAPPVLAVSDAAVIGRYVGATLMVARAGRHPIRELEQAVRRFAQAGIAVKGFVFNDLDLERQRYRYGYKGYVYRYSYDKTES